MDIIFKAIITGIAALFLLTGGIAVILGTTELTEVSDYLESVSAAIVESNYSDAIIEECCREAEAYGYELTVSVYGGDVCGGTKYADIRLNYVFEIPLIGYRAQMSRQKVI